MNADLERFFEDSGPYPADIEKQMRRDWDEAIAQNAAEEES